MKGTLDRLVPYLEVDVEVEDDPLTIQVDTTDAALVASTAEGDVLDNDTKVGDAVSKGTEAITKYQTKYSKPLDRHSK
jgi:hypothetical protein